MGQASRRKLKIVADQKAAPTEPVVIELSAKTTLKLHALYFKALGSKAVAEAAIASNQAQSTEYTNAVTGIVESNDLELPPQDRWQIDFAAQTLTITPETKPEPPVEETKAD